MMYFKWILEIAEQKLTDSKEEIEGVIAIYQGIDVKNKKAKKTLKKAIKNSEQLLRNINKDFF